MPNNSKKILVNEIKINIYIIIYSIIVSSILYFLDKFTSSYDVVLICTIVMLIVSRYMYELIDFIWKKFKRKNV